MLLPSLPLLPSSYAVAHSLYRLIFQTPWDRSVLSSLVIPACDAVAVADLLVGWLLHSHIRCSILLHLLRLRLLLLLLPPMLLPLDCWLRKQHWLHHRRLALSDDLLIIPSSRIRSICANVPVEKLAFNELKIRTRVLRRLVVSSPGVRASWPPPRCSSARPA